MLHLQYRRESCRRLLLCPSVRILCGALAKELQKGPCDGSGRSNFPYLAEGGGQDNDLGSKEREPSGSVTDCQGANRSTTWQIQGQSVWACSRRALEPRESPAAGELLREPTNNTPVRVALAPSGSGHTLTRCQQRASPLAAMGSPPRRRCTMLLRDKMQSPWFGKRKSFARASWSVRTGCSSCCSPSAEQLGDQFGDRSSFPWATGEWRATLEEGRPSAA